MNGLSKRIVVLAAFGVFVAVVLILTQIIRSKRQSGPLSSERQPPGTIAEREPPPKLILPSTSAAHKTYRLQAERPQARPTKPATTTPRHSKLEEIFSSGLEEENLQLDRMEVEQLLREHVDRNHPHLKLSSEDYGQLAASIMAFRDARNRTRSTKRTSMNAPAFRQSLEDAKEAMREFKKITGMSPDEFFMGEDSPIRFGEDEALYRGNDDEIVTEHLSDHKP